MSSVGVHRPLEISSGCSRHGRESTGRTMSKTGGEMNAAKQTMLPPRSKLPYIQNLAKSTDGIRCSNDGCPNLTRSLLATKNQEAGGSHFLFDKTYERLQRTTTLVPPLPRKYHVHRTGNLRPLGLSKDLSHSQVRPLSLGSCEGYDLSRNPSFLFPSALVLNKRNTFSVDNCLLNRPKVNHRAYNLLTIKDVQKAQELYPDPMLGAPHSFLHRVSELSSMEGETARQEKLGRNSKHRKHESS